MEFTVQHREKSGKGVNRKLRAAGLNPGIIYGMGEEVMVSMRSDYAYRLIESLHGARKPLTLNIEKGGKTEAKQVIIQDYQTSNWGERLYHIDFREVSDDTVLHFEAPIVTKGDSKGVKLGGILQIIRHSIPVTCAVKDIPEAIEIDITEMDFGDSIHVLDFEYPQGVKPIVTGRNFTLMTVTGAGGSDEAEETTEEGTEEAAAE